MPVISYKHKFVFVHIPKTAGTSISRRLFREEHFSLYKAVKKVKFISNYLFTCQLYALLFTPDLHKHAKAREIRSVVGEKVWNDFYTFAFVRNPWDLMVSSYKWWLQKANIWPHLKEDIDNIKKMDGFNSFIRSDYGRKMLNEQYGNIYDWISDEKGQIMLDYVGRFENLEEDFYSISEEIGLPVKELPRVNVTNRDHYREYYDDYTKSIVEERFHKTIKLFDYHF